MTSERATAPLLLWDVMSTLVRDPYADLPAHFGMSASELGAAQDPTAWIEFERGHIDEHSYTRRFFADGRPVELEALKARLRAGYRYMEGVPELLRELKARGHRQLVLSNYPRWYSLIEERLGLSRFVEWGFVSCHSGHRKPEEAAYAHACAALQVAPGDCLFIDDRPDNVDAARAFGMQAILREPSIEALRAALAARGLL